MTNQEKIAKLFEMLEKAEVYGRAIGKLSFDMECTAPKEGMEQAGNDMATLAKVPFEITHSEEYIRLITELKEDGEGLSELQKRLIELLNREYDKTKNMTPEFAYEMDKARATAYSVWLNAKQEQKFELFSGSLNTLIDFQRRAIDFIGEREGSYYDVCLDNFEKGNSERKMEAFFDKIKERVVPLVEEIREHGKPIRSDFLSRPVPIDKQQAVSAMLLDREGLRKDALVLATTEHPFTTSFGPHDVRVATHYYETNFFSNVFSVLHEGGHALFMQNEPEELHHNHVADKMSTAMHECMSRFFENIIGRSEHFIHWFYPEMQKICGDTFKDVTEREVFEAVNIAQPGLIRVEADELTYPLHILIRYEIEKAFINGEITTEQIPELWNKKYKEYLGIGPGNDAEGSLQDVHWTDYYGYFPTYALGSAYGMQIVRKMEQDIDIWSSVEKGDLEPAARWLKEHAFSCASLLDPDEWIMKVTGEPFNVNYYLDYLENKFRKLYEI